MDLTGKAAIVTGAGSGIGYAIAERLGAAGAAAVGEPRRWPRWLFSSPRRLLLRHRLDLLRRRANGPQRGPALGCSVPRVSRVSSAPGRPEPEPDRDCGLQVAVRAGTDCGAATRR